METDESDSKFFDELNRLSALSYHSEPLLAMGEREQNEAIEKYRLGLCNKTGNKTWKMVLKQKTRTPLGRDTLTFVFERD
jgi:hypothetical protein